MIDRKDVQRALARAYCTPDNMHKPIDVQLVEAMTAEVLELIGVKLAQILESANGGAKHG